jgi:hypothetical protein
LLLLAGCDSKKVDMQVMTLQSGKQVVTSTAGKPSGAGTISLPSGKQIRVLNIYHINFAKAPPAAIFSYQTDISMDDRPALQREVDEIWPVFRPDVERAGLTGAVISANEKPVGGQNRGYNFVFVRAADGSWSQVDK